jgi:ABC-type Fe3+-siderophore transport system permease subunit
MPRHDPTPPSLERTAQAWKRYKALMSWMALASVVTAILAVVILYATGTELRIHLVIATLAGVGLSVLLGTGLMGLVYFSSHSGHDEGAQQSSSLMGSRDDQIGRGDD